MTVLRQKIEDIIFEDCTQGCVPGYLPCASCDTITNSILKVVLSEKKALAAELRPPNECPLDVQVQKSDLRSINPVMCPHNILIQDAFDARLALED